MNIRIIQIDYCTRFKLRCTHNLKHILKAIFVGLFAFLSQSVFSGPEGGEVVGGAGNISRDGTTTTINQATDRMAIDWQSYNVNANERVHYIQPDSSSVSLNRILSNSASHIHGRIDANGQVFLVNPNGVFFGKDSVINAGGILASGLSIDPDDFMNGDFVFSALEGTDGLVINGGLLNAATGGYAYLLGQQIQNDGVISAQLGSVNLAAGREAILTFDDGGLLGVQITESILQDEIGVDAAIVNNGEITAQDGQILISAAASQDVFTQAVNAGELKQARSVVVDEDGSFTLSAGANVVNTGTISASGDSGGDIIVLGENITSSGSISADADTNTGVRAVGDVNQQAGNIEIHSVDTTLVTEQGSVSATASTGLGGDIKLLGDKVGLSDSAAVNASGESGGGQVLFGGDKTGSNNLVRNAQLIFLGEQTSIYADALGNGNGGRLITFAEDTARIYGNLFARGGAYGGNGGFIETSGLKSFQIENSPDTSAGFGVAGEWLIDPYDITISNSANELSGDPNFVSSATESNLSIATLSSSLFFNSVVTVQTASAGGEDGNIDLNNSLGPFLGGESTLVLNAHGDININSAITASGAALNIVLNANYDSSTGNVLLGSSNIDTNGGYLAFNANNVGGTDDIPAAKDGTLDSGFTGTITTDGGDVFVGVVDDTDGTIIDSDGGTAGLQVTADPIAGGFWSAGTINVSSNDGGGDIDINATGDATLNIVTIGDTRTSSEPGVGTSSSSYDVDADNIYVNGTLTYGVDDSVANHAVNFNLTAAQDIDFTGGTADNTGGGNDVLNVSLTANTTDGVITIDGDTSLWLTGGTFTASTHDFTLGSGATTDLIGTEGGDFTVGTSGTPITGTFTSDFTNSRIATNFNSSAAGDISIYADEDIDLGYLHRTTWESTDSDDFTLNIFAGDDLLIGRDIELERLTGTGTNTINFGAGNAVDGDNADGIEVDGEIVNDVDASNITFDIVTGGNDVDFINTAEINSFGGDVNVFVTGDASVQSDITTRGGDFSVGDTGNTIFPTSFDNSVGGAGGTINTRSDDGGGAVAIYSSGDVTLDEITLGDSNNDDSDNAAVSTRHSYVIAGHDIVLNNVIGNFVAEDDVSSSDGSNGDVVFRAGNDFTSNAEIQNGDGDLVIVAGDVDCGSVTCAPDASSRDVTINDDVVTLGDITIHAADHIILDDGIGDEFAGYDVPSSISFRAGDSINGVGGTAFDRTDINATGIVTIAAAETTFPTYDVLSPFAAVTGSVTLRSSIYSNGNNINISGNSFSYLDDNNEDGASPPPPVSGIYSDGGDVNIDVAGAVSIANPVNTNGGSFSVGATTQASSYVHTSTLDTTSGTSGLDGNVSIDTTGTATLGQIDTATGTDCGVGNNEICGDLTVLADDAITQTAALTVSGITTLDSVAASITLTNASNNFGNNVYIVNSGDASLVDTDDIVLGDSAGTSNIAGSLTISAIGITDAGALTVTGTTDLTSGTGVVALDDGAHDFQDEVTIVSASQLTLDDTNALTLGNIDIDGAALANTITAGGAITQSGGDNIISTGIGAASGAITIQGTSVDINDVTTTGLDDYNAGDVTLVGTSGAVEAGAINANGGNAVTGIGSGANDGRDGLNGGTVIVSGEGSIDITSIDTSGSDSYDGNDNGTNAFTGGNAGSVTVTSNTSNVSLGAVSADGGDGFAIVGGGSAGNDDANGGDANDIVITANSGSGNVNLGGNLYARGGHVFDGEANASGVTNGLGGAITINGNIVLTSSIEMDSDLAPNDLSSPGTGASTPADIEITGTANGTTALTEALTINGANFDFDGNVGGITSLGAITIDATGAINIDNEDLTIRAASFDVNSGTSFYSSHIDTTGDTGAAGGAVEISVDSTLTTGDLTSVGDTNQNAGAVTLSGTDIVVGAIDTSAPGATGGTVAVTATENDGTPSIQINGDVNTENAAANGSFVLAGTGTTTGSVVLNTNTVLSSDISVTGNTEAGATDSFTGPNVVSIWSVNADQDGSITDGGATSTITYTDFDVLQGGSAADTFNVTGAFTGNISGGADIDTFDIDAVIAGSLNGEAGDDIFTLDADVTVALNAGDDDDTFNINTTITAASNINGDGGDDTFNVDDSSDISVTIVGGESAEDGDGDTLELVETTGTHAWALATNSSGTLNTDIVFSEIENLDGSDGGEDTFDFNFVGQFEGDVDARLGSDIVDLVDAGVTNINVVLGADINDVQNAEIVRGAGAASTFTVTGGTGSGTTTWTISDFDGAGSAADGVNDGVVTNGGNSTSFIDFGILVGDSENDQFTVANTASIVSVDGATGTANTLSYWAGANTDADWVITGANDGTIDSTTLTFTEIHTITGSGDDNLQARNSQTNTWELTAADGGTVEDGGANDTIAFDGFDSLSGGDEIDIFNVNNGVNFSGSLSGGDGNDVFNLVDDVTGSVSGNADDDDFNITNLALTSILFGNGGDDELYVLGNNVDVSFNGGANDDTVIGFNDAVNNNNWDVNNNLLTNDASGAVIDFSNVEILTGGSGVDIFTLSANITRTLNGSGGIDEIVAPNSTNTWILTSDNSGTFNSDTSFTGIDTLTGGTGTDELTGINQNNNWQITSTNSGTVDDTEDSSGDITFTDIEELVGGSGDDTFTLGASGAIDSIDGAESADDDDTILGRTTANTWNLTDTNLGDLQTTVGPTTYVGSFTNIETLEGSGTAADIFNFSEFVNYNIVAGASSGDTANYSNVDDDVAITVGAGIVNGLDDIEEVVGNNDGLVNIANDSTLTLDSGGVSSAWTISDANGGDGVNDGQIDFGTTTVVFTDFNNLVGGSGNDTFDLDPASGNSGITGDINGGAGTSDTITARDVATTWNILEDTSGGVGNEFAEGNFVYESGAGQFTTTFERVEVINGSDVGDIYNVDNFTVGGAFAITLNAGTGVDIINLPNQDLDITLGLAIGGIGLNGIDTISANSLSENILRSTSSNGASVGWSIDDENSGTVDGVDFENFQSIYGGDGNDTFTFSATGSVETLVDGGAGSNSIVANAVATRWNISGANVGSVDDITGPVDTYIGSFQNIQTLTGSSVSNDFVFGSSGYFDGTITGGAGTDEISVAQMVGEDTLWLVDNASVEAGTVRRADSTDNSSITSSATFSEIESLVGGDGADKFIFSSAAAFTGNADAGDGANDVVDLSGVGAVAVTASTSNIHGIDNAEIIIGNDSSTSLTGFDSGANTWTIDGANEGQLENGATTIEFENVNTLIGSGTVNDQFDFEVGGSISGQVEGGAGGTDIVTGADDTNAWTLSTALAGHVDGSNFIEIEEIVGGSGADTIFGRAQENNWSINAANAGYVQGANSSDRITFSEVENLSGNSSDDYFVFDSTGSLSGVIDADAGALSTGDSLTVSSTSGQLITWTLNGTSSGAIGTFLPNGFSDVDLIIGGDGQDTVNINSAFSGDIQTLANADTINLAASAAGTINAGDDDDQINITNSSANANLIEGDSGSDTISVTHAGDSDWVVNATSGGGTLTSTGLVTFDEMDELIGNDAIDTVDVDANFTGTIQTQGGNDIVNLNADTSSLLTQAGDDVVTVESTTITASIDTGTNSDELIGPSRGMSAENDWSITSDNTGTLNTNVSFANVENLSGNDGDDVFTFANNASVTNVRGIALSLGADTGSDTLSIDDAGTTTWTISGDGEGTVNVGASNFYDIENLTGGGDVDQFVFNDINALISGLIDGGEGEIAPTIDGVTDTLDLTVFTSGVVVELGDTVTGTNPEPSVTTNLHVHNVEQITAAPGAVDSDQNDNWLAVNYTEDVRWRLTPFNDGYFELLVSVADGTAIENTRIDFFNFGSMRGGDGNEDSDINPGTNITGQYIAGDGLRTLNFGAIDPAELILVDIDDRILSVTGNGNTIIRSVASTNDDWTINAPNAGQYTNNVDITFDFNQVNQLIGGGGNDSFTFSATGDLIDGSINGGTGVNTIDSSTALSDLSFGLNELESNVTVSVSYIGGVISSVDFTETLLASRAGVVDLLNISELDANATTDNTLYSGVTTDYIWSIGQSGTDNSLSGNAQTLTFTNVDTIIGGDANDTFNVFALGSTTDIYDGGLGDDTVDVTALSSAINISLDSEVTSNIDVQLQGVETLELSGAANRIVGGDAGSTWTINQINSGSVAYSDDAFTGTQNLDISGNVSHVVAGGGNDDFIFTGAGIINGTIDGGAGIDTIDGNASSQAVILQVSGVNDNVTDTGTDVVDIFGFEDVSLNGAQNNELRSNDVATNTWTINGTDAGTLNGMTFSGISSLTGSASIDNFTLDGSDEITGVIDGGSGVGVVDQVNVTGLIRDVVVSVSNVSSGDISITNIERVDALGANNQLIAGDEVNNWLVDDSDAGQLVGETFENVLGFTGFANIHGGSDRDAFVFDINGQISGQIDGSDPAIGTALQIDTVDLSAIDNAVTISLNTAVDGDVDLINIEEIIANATYGNSLYADDIDNNWVIDDENSGDLLNSNIAFSGFANLFGGSGNDIFTFEALGDITGVVDGGGQPGGGADQVDMSQLAIVRVVIGDTTSGFIDIESYRGNNTDSVITAANLTNTWTLDGAENSGRIVDQLLNTILFEDFNELEGGTQNDDFILAGGSVSGEIRAGLGNDDLIVDVVSGVNGQVNFVGGDGTDSVSTTGGDTEYTANYSADGSGGASLEYNFQDTSTLVTYTVTYSEVEDVTDNVVADILTINDLDGNSDIISLDTAQFSINSFEQVNYDNKDSLSVLSETNDTISIDGPLVLADSIELVNGAVEANAPDSSLQALQITFNGNQSVGSPDTPIEINADGLAVQSVLGDVYLNEANSVSITAFSNNSSSIRLNANESIIDTLPLSGSSPIYFTSANGDILLDESNSFTGVVNLDAAISVEFTNTSTTLFGNVSAQNLTVVASGNVTDQGVISITADAAFSMNGNNLILDGASNDLTNVNVLNANTVTLVDVDTIAVQGNASADFAVVAEGVVDVVSALSADDVDLQSNSGAISVNGNIDADNAIVLTGSGVNIAASLRVDNNNSLVPAVSLDAGTGALIVAGDIDTSNPNASAGDVVLQGNSFDQQIGANISAGDVDIVSATFINQASDITAEGNVTNTAQNGDLFMASGTVTQGYEVELSSVGVITIETIIAEIFTVNGVNVLQNGDVNASGDVSYTVDTSLQMAQTSSLSSNGGNIDLSADSLDLEGSVNSTSGTITTSSISDTQIGGVLDAQSVEVNSAGAVAMDSLASIIADSSVSLNAEGDIAVSNVQATDADGQITVVSNSGGLQDNNGGSVNFVAYSLDLDTETNIGTSSDAIDTQIEQLSALNNGAGTSGSVNFSNDGELSVILLRSNTDINIANVGTLTMVNSSGPEFEYNQNDLDARTAGGVINANYNSGTVNIDVSNGDLLASNPPRVNRNRPEIVGEFVNVAVDGNFGGTNGRPIVVYVQEQMSISRASGGIFPIWGFNEPPNSPLITDADLVDSSAVANVSELLIDVESVDEIDPAVFTEVRNYSYDNISIRMPRDQLYEDDEEEAEEDEFAL